MPILMVVNNPQDWPLHVPGVEVVAARAYLTDSAYANLKGAKVFNCCRSYRYQSVGYYVSLLAAARGHKPVPNLATIQDMKSPAIVRLTSEEIEDLTQKSLTDIKSPNFQLSIYFGRNLARKHDRLASQLFKLFHAPFLRAHFENDPKEGWRLQKIGPISEREIPASHHPFVIEVATEYFANRRFSVGRRELSRYDLAILYDTRTPSPASDETAVRRFVRAAESLGFHAETISRDDFSSVGEYDALFIRDTTNVNHYTYRFAQRAHAEGLVVIDDPESILKCTNKVYLAEILNRHGILAPKTLIVHKDNVGEIVPQLGLPCILKAPDSSFSAGVKKADTEAEALSLAEAMLDKSDLVLAQAFVPTEFDWRIGIIDRRAIYACKYFMARKHWQIIHRDEQQQARYGKWETLPIELAPPAVVRTALKAANLIGDGLYGVDLKQVGKEVYVIEINDNPSLDSGVEDQVLKGELYRRIMEVFLQRLERRRQGLAR